jgi:hypothetical protein
MVGPIRAEARACSEVVVVRGGHNNVSLSSNILLRTEYGKGLE